MTPTSMDDLLDQTLPLNRKERYFTGTVLPALVGDNLQHLHRLAELVGVETVEVRADRDDCTVLLFTEYGISESAIGDAAARLSGLPTGRDTPDVVVLVTEPSPVLIAVEAKLYDRPSRAELVAQLEGQRRLLDPLVNRLGDWLGVEGVRLRHVALLPEALRDAIEAGGWVARRSRHHLGAGARRLVGHRRLLPRRVGDRPGTLPRPGQPVGRQPGQ